MKKFIYLFALIITTMSFAQDTEPNIDFNKNELKGNALFLVLGSFDFSYERILSEESGVGVSINMPFDRENWDINYAVTGYYRYYFGKKPAAGFFGEAFGMLNNVDDYIYNENGTFYTFEPKTLTDKTFSPKASTGFNRKNTDDKNSSTLRERTGSTKKKGTAKTA